MKLFNWGQDAAISYDDEDKIFMNRMCPFTDRLCGNWCALFKDFPDSSGNTQVIMGCKSNHENVESLPDFKKE